MINTDTRLMTREELAQALNVTTRHIYNLEKQGLPVLRVGGRVRYDWDEVMTFLRNHCGQLRGTPRVLRKKLHDTPKPFGIQPVKPVAIPPIAPIPPIPPAALTPAFGLASRRPLRRHLRRYQTPKVVSSGYSEMIRLVLEGVTRK